MGRMTEIRTGFFSLVTAFLLGPGVADAIELVPLKMEPLTPIAGRSLDWDWWQARTAYVPSPSPQWITTMSETGRSGTHNFHDIYQAVSRDGGRSWSVLETGPAG